MGTDIHMFVERREGASSPWRPAIAPISCGWSSKEAAHPPDCFGCRGTGFELVWQDRIVFGFDS